MVLGGLVVVAVVALPLFLLLLKPPPGPPKPPGKLVRVENFTRAVSGRGLQLSAGTIGTDGCVWKNVLKMVTEN